MEWLIVGFVVGLLMNVVNRLLERPAGVLKIDRSNPEKDVYRFEIDDLDSLRKKKRIVLKIDNGAAISHE